MDHEQLEKRVEWLDKERRENLSTINKLIKRIDKMEGREKKSDQFVKDLSSDVTKFSVDIKKMNEFDDALSKHKLEVKSQIDKHKKLAKNREKEGKKKIDMDIVSLRKENVEILKDFTNIKKFIDKVDEFQTNIDLFATQFEDNNEKQLANNEIIANSSLKLTTLEDDLRISNNQSNEFTGEMSALRKKVDEHSNQIDFAQLSQKRLDERWENILKDHIEETESQYLMFEEVQKGHQEQKSQWNKWNKSIENVNKLSKTISENLLNLDEAERSLKNARERFQGITDQIERRINEITEIQRLGDDRYRQEWVTFKSDQQKRWTNQSISQEEQHKNIERQSERIDSELSELTVNFDKLNGLVNLMVENSDNRLSTLMNHFRDWINESEKQSRTYK